MLALIVTALGIHSTACAGRGLQHEPSLTEDPNARVVRDVVDVMGAFRTSVYARPAFDPPKLLNAHSVRLAIADDRTVCPIPPFSLWWSMAKRATRPPCPTGWRMAR